MKRFLAVCFLIIFALPLSKAAARTRVASPVCTCSVQTFGAENPDSILFWILKSEFAAADGKATTQVVGQFFAKADLGLREFYQFCSDKIAATPTCGAQK